MCQGGSTSDMSHNEFGRSRGFPLRVFSAIADNKEVPGHNLLLVNPSFGVQGFR